MIWMWRGGVRGRGWGWAACLFAMATVAAGSSVQAPGGGRAATRPGDEVAAPQDRRPMPPPAPRHELHRAERVELVLLHLPGISGYRSIDQTLLQGLMDALGRDRMAVRVYDWPAYDYGMGALLNERRNRIEAQHAAAWIAESVSAFPGAKVVLTSHSGGAGIAAWALEALPEGVGVDAWVLLAPALSPEFDLSAALGRVRGGAWALVSQRDPVLPMTRVFGTIDRKNVPSAGLKGFEPPAGHDATAYGKLRTVDYDPAWMKYGHLGDHIGMMERAFAREVLGPMLRDVVDVAGDVPAKSR